MNANAEKAHWHTATDASDPHLLNFQTCGILIDSSEWVLFLKEICWLLTCFLKSPDHLKRSGGL